MTLLMTQPFERELEQTIFCLSATSNQSQLTISAVVVSVVTGQSQGLMNQIKDTTNQTVLWPLSDQYWSLSLTDTSLSCLPLWISILNKTYIDMINVCVFVFEQWEWSSEQKLKCRRWATFDNNNLLHAICTWGHTRSLT